jgi:hypothetical protein
MLTVERIAALEKVLDDLDAAYHTLFELGYTAEGNAVMGAAERIEGKIMDLEEEAGLV